MNRGRAVGEVVGVPFDRSSTILDNQLLGCQNMLTCRSPRTRVQATYLLFLPRLFGFVDKYRNVWR